MNSYKKLAANSFIFAAGTLGSKIIAFLLVPLYTYYLSTSEFGTVDITITTANLLIPIISLSMFEAVFRFAMDKKEDSDQVVTNALIIATLGFLLSGLFYPLVLRLNLFGDYFVYFYLILFIQIIERILAQYARAIGRIKVFAINGILLSFLIGILNIVFLVIFEWGIAGYFFAYILATFISVLYLTSKTDLIKSIKLEYLNKEHSRKLILYSIPMIPNSLMWWLINASSRYFIIYFIDVSANGLFAVASRIPSLINIINQVFTQAWQLSAIEEFEKETADTSGNSFQKDVFTFLHTFLFFGVSLILLVIIPIFRFLLAPQYFEAWQVVPFLLMGAVFSSFSSFLGTNYIVTKKTSGVFKTSLYGGLASLVLNTSLIYLFGLIGAGISSMISFYLMFLLRYYDTKEIGTLTIKWKNFYKTLLVLSLQTASLYLYESIWLQTILGLVFLLVLIVINRTIFSLLYKVMLRILRNKFRK